MRTAYRVLGYLIALEVLVQAAAIAYAYFGLGAWIEEGGVLDKAAMESDSTTFTGVAGFAVHGLNGEIVVPLLAVALLVVSFFAKVPGGIRWAAIVLGTVVVQVLLAIAAHATPALGMLHGAVAIALLVVALVAARRAEAVRTAAPEPVRVA